MSNTQDQPNKPRQQGAPQQTQDMPSSGNSREVTGAARGTDESSGGGSQDVERSGMSGTGTQRAADAVTTGDPDRTPGKAEGSENPKGKGSE
jgi:hypothetical protein